MNFCSLKYGYFLLILIPCYFAVPKRIQKYVLLLFSIVFYLSFSVKAFVIMTLTGIITYAASLCIGKEKDRRKRKPLLVLSITLDLGILVLLKYSDFLSHITGLKWLSVINTGVIERYSLVLPLGISFYTLSLIGYLIDVYREKVTPETNFFVFYLFETFFPHILQGPIARYNTLAVQFKEKHEFEYNRFCYGLQLMLWGYIKKMVIADRAAILVNGIYDTYYTVGGTELFVASLLYTLTIFADFSGCVDIAKGTAYIFGIELSDNFRQPYLATSINDFWRRWHISLSSWFRDYLYIPLGGNRKGEVRRWVNVLIVFGVSGIWHGAGWNYLLWGALHGGYQIASNALENIRHKWYQFLKINETGKAARIFKILVTLNLVNIAWIFFRVTDVRQACYILKTIILCPTIGILFDESLAQFGVSMKGLQILCVFTLLLAAVEIMHYRGRKMRDWISSHGLVFRWCVYLCGVLSVVILGMYGVDYKASDFIYVGF